MVTVVYDNSKDLATERFGMNERMERIAQLWLGRLLQEPGVIDRLNRYVFRKRPAASVGGKFEDIRQMALLGTWKRIVRALARGGAVQASYEEDLDDPDAELPLDVDRLLWAAITENDEAAFQGVAKMLIFNQIGFKGADLTKKETHETIQTEPLYPETVGGPPLRRNENLAPNDYSERNGKSLIDPDLHYPDTPEEVEERENSQSEGQRLQESWLNWLWGIHERSSDAKHKRRLEACIEFERLAFIDDGRVSINEKIRKPQDDDPFLYHGILGRTHGVRKRLAQQYEISLRYFEIELQLMRNEYWPAWVATVIEENK